MSWVNRLLKRLTSAWSTDPQGIVAMCVACDGTSLAWQVADGTLTLTPTGGTASPLLIPLGGPGEPIHIGGLAQLIDNNQGYSVTQLAAPGLRSLSPLTLADGSGNTNDFNGGQILLATSPQYLMLQAAGAELAAIEAQIPNMPPQMATTTASGSWLDYLGTYYVVPRMVNEGDVAYAIRIVQEVILPKCNNVAMARALQFYTGVPFQVTDVVTYAPGTPLLNDPFALDGSHTLGSNVSPGQAGLFDVEGGYDLIQGTELTDMTDAITGMVNRLRATGTQMRNLTLAPLSALADTATAPNDAGDSLAISYSQLLDGSYLMNGENPLASGLTLTQTISGTPT